MKARWACPIGKLLLVCACLLSACQSTKPQSVPSETSKPVVEIVEDREDLNLKESKAWIQGKINYLKSLYQERLDPYFGKRDQGSSCESSAVKLQVEKSNEDLVYVQYLVLTTQAGAAGVCDTNLQTHQMTLVFAACLNRPLQFTLKEICPITSTEPSRGCSIVEEQLSRYCAVRSLSRKP